MLRIVIIIFTIMISLPDRCLAYSAKDISQIIYKTAKEYNISPYLIAAIAERESSYWPWAVNVQGQGYYFENKQDVLKFVNRLDNYDLGLMQINSWWIKKFGLDVERVIDPQNNILMGIYVFKECEIRMGRNLENILSCYHRGKIDEKGIRYARKVLEIYRKFLER